MYHSCGGLVKRRCANNEPEVPARTVCASRHRDLGISFYTGMFFFFEALFSHNIAEMVPGT
jgi:hypothetical protein